MKRVLLISLSLVLTLVGWSIVGAQDGFYVIPTIKGKYAPVPKTGQMVINGPADDGTLQKGVAWPTPRFTNNGNGTVTDNLTGLIWMRDANAFESKNWDNAMTTANNLEAGYGGLLDGSKPGDWRLPNVRELHSLIDYGHFVPALPQPHPFINVLPNRYWSSTSGWIPGIGDFGYYVDFWDGCVYHDIGKTGSAYVWCVRGGK